MAAYRLAEAGLIRGWCPFGFGEPAKLIPVEITPAGRLALLESERRDTHRAKMLRAIRRVLVWLGAIAGAIKGVAVLLGYLAELMR